MRDEETRIKGLLRLNREFERRLRAIDSLEEFVRCRIDVIEEYGVFTGGDTLEKAQLNVHQEADCIRGYILNSRGKD